MTFCSTELRQHHCPGVYQILHVATGRQYVGSAKNLARRFRAHRSDLTLGKHHSSKLQRAWDKYGAAAFVFDVIERCAVEELLAREQHWMDRSDAFRSGFNCRPRAESRLGAKASKALRAKLSMAHSGKPLSPRHRASLAEALRCLDVRDKISRALKGRSLPEETRRKMSLAKRGNKNAAGTSRDPALVARLAVAMRGNQFGKGFKHTPAMLAARSARRGIPWSASRRAKYEASL